MKKISLCFAFLVCCTYTFSIEKTDSLLTALDRLMEKHQVYVDKKEERINRIKKQARVSPLSLDELYSINTQLYKEYKTFICDSAIAYLHQNLDIARQMDDREKLTQTQLWLSYLLASAGMYKESIDLLENMDRSNLEEKFLAEYYECYDHAYGELAFYTQDDRHASEYRKQALNYKDSLYRVVDHNSDLYLNMKETLYRDEKNFEECKRISDLRMSKVQPETHEYAVVTFYRALLFREQGDMEQFKKYLVLSAMTDIRTGTKDQASLWMLADLLYEEGDINRAYKYIRFSWDESNFYNARLREGQVAKVLSFIDRTYQLESEKHKNKLRLSLIFISILSVFLLLAVGYIYRQVKRLAKARNNLQEANNRLNELNKELSGMNHSLQTINLELFESNRVKEEYIGRFMSLCSTYIDKLEAYRRMVNKKLSAGKTAELFRLTQSSEVTEKELKEFYRNFDTTFLHLYPDFVEQFNALLANSERIVLKKGELLNTELRIFALIRLGIEDSSRIAEFLRYSVNTIYNYRAKVKNKAKISREDFENQVMKIGAFNK